MSAWHRHNIYGLATWDEIIMWTLKLLDIEWFSTAKVLQAGCRKTLEVGWTQQGQFTALIEYLTVILEYTNLIQFLLVGYSQLFFGPGRYQAHQWLHFLTQGIQLIFKILEVYLCDHNCQLEYSKNTQVTTGLFLLNSAHYPVPLMKQTFL